jgi:hypothetical protein
LAFCAVTLQLPVGLSLEIWIFYLSYYWVV